MDTRSEDRGEEAEDGFEHSLEEGATAPGGDRYFCALRHVAEKDVAHFTIERLVVDEDVALEIVLKTAEVEVRAARRHQIVVDDHRLRMKHPRIVEIHLDPRLETLRHERERRIPEHPRITPARYHDAHVNLRQRCCLKGIVQGIRGQEIWRLDID